MEVNEELIHRYRVVSKRHRTTKHTSSDHWDYLLCEVFERRKYGYFYAPDTKRGEYVRNYSAFYKTFHPFEKDGRHYALYSKDYTATRVMSLPNCEDLGGEERNNFGFCPVEYAVPYFEYETQPTLPEDPEPGPNPRNDTKKWVQLIDRRYYRPGDKQYTLGYSTEEYEKAIAEYDKSWKGWFARNPYITKRFNSEFGFVAGCVWGDDTSWKVQYLDLTRVAEGIIIRDDRFGYIQLLDKQNLKDAISLCSWSPENPWVHIGSAQTFRTTEKANDAL